MPPYDPRVRYPQGNVRLSIPTLNGGVGRRAPTKRAVNEAQNLDNVLCTLERSAEKRSPMKFIRRYNDGRFDQLNDDTFSQFDFGSDSVDANFFFFWFSVSDEQRYLVCVDYASNDPNTFFTVHRTTKEGFYKCNVDNADEFHAYLTYGYAEGGVNPLKAITIGPQLILLNTNVHAGYSSVEREFNAGDQITLGDGTDYTVQADGEKFWCKIDFDGDFKTPYEEDLEGRKITYYTTIPVDPEGQASIYVESKYYILNDQVFHPMADGTDLGEYLKKKYSETGQVEFAEILLEQNQPYSWKVLEEDIPGAKTHFHMVGVEVIDGSNDPSANTLDKVILTFDQDAGGREKWLEMDKFSLDGVNLPMEPESAPGAYDGYTLSDNGSDEWYITWEGASVGDPAHDLSEVFRQAWDVNTTVQTEDYSFRGVVTDYTWPSNLDDYVEDAAAGDYRIKNNGDDLTIIFTCIKEGVAEGPFPQSSAEAGEGAAAFGLRSDADGGSVGEFIPVEDWKYPEASKAYLGQALTDFSEFKFPPNANDVNLSSDGPEPTKATDTLAALYPEELLNGQNGRTIADGTGKVYHVENSYAGEDPGFYIIRNAEEKPYLMKVRSPLEYSVIDRVRFPKILKIDSINDVTQMETFKLQDFELEHRTSGTLSSNPGPEAFKDGTQVRVQSMAFFRDRLFLSAGDIVFSSKTRDFSDFWAVNPSTVTDRDPIDVRLSTNKYTPITTMTPFQQYLFINTESDVQFTMQGSENRITPLNAEVSPTAFYSTSPLVDPILLGSQIYFFAPRRTYIYFNDATVSVNQAVETSLNAPDYLPTNFGHTTVVPGYDTILMQDDDNSKYLYLYTNRYSGGQVAQNAFFRYIYRVDIEHVESFDNDMYFVTRQPDGEGYKYNLGYQRFREEDYSVPLLDNYVTVGGPDDEGNVSYDPNTDTTVWSIPKFFNLNPEFLYINVQENDPRSGEVINLLPENVSINNGTVQIVLDGDQTYAGRQWTVGTGYTMTIELSPQYYRDQEQNAIEGVLSLRTMSTQHFNTGTYRIEKDINGRRQTTLTFSPEELDAEQYTSGFDVLLPLYEGRGETFSKILGYAADTSIFIISDYASPVNITQIELKGRFTGKSSGFVR